MISSPQEVTTYLIAQFQQMISLLTNYNNKLLTNKNLNQNLHQPSLVGILMKHLLLNHLLHHTLPQIQNPSHHTQPQIQHQM